MKTSRSVEQRSTGSRGWLVAIQTILALAFLIALIRSNRGRLLNRLRAFNKRYTNPRVLKFAERRKSPYAVLQHAGRRSGSIYTTPVVADFVPRLNRFIIPLPYGEGTDWCRNVMATGRCTLTKSKVTYTLVEPSIIEASDVLADLPAQLQGMLRFLGLKKFLQLRIETSAPSARTIDLVSALER
ncbi:hypothetical protein KDH_74390 [Dictyobacter sp. S3.2.2.5]|uniref:Nitroreductase n=1 Tax=Dictyobacter halimunensis TaxID=3026934 RepID=A0ABQ6G4W8_9CHLR|nr:hypothetical protein KDH_74390 [Dictyobacter sp. S3.2.2.5]